MAAKMLLEGWRIAYAVMLLAAIHTTTACERSSVVTDYGCVSRARTLIRERFWRWW